MCNVMRNDMWSMIGNISGIVTCLMCIIYFIGRIWKIHIQKESIIEKMNFEKVDEELGVDYIDLSDDSEYGVILSLSSPSGIRRVSIFDVEMCEDSDTIFKPGKLIETEKIFLRTKKYILGFCCLMVPPSVYLEIERNDYIVTSCAVSDSGRDGRLVQFNRKSRMTLKSWLYYLFV